MAIVTARSRKCSASATRPSIATCVPQMWHRTTSSQMATPTRTPQMWRIRSPRGRNAKRSARSATRVLPSTLRMFRSPSQLAFVALAIEKIEATFAKDRQRAVGGADPGPLVERMPQADEGKARDKAAVAVGVNPRYVSDAKAISELEFASALRLRTRVRRCRPRRAEVCNPAVLRAFGVCMGVRA